MNDLRSFVKSLEEEGDLLKIDGEVSPRFEVSAIMKKYDGKEALLFEKVKSYGKVVAGVCGTKKRLAKALSVSLEKMRPRLIGAIRNPREPSLTDTLQAEGELTGLRKLPILTHFERDAAPYITSAVVAAGLPNGAGENVSIHRLMIIDDRHMAIRIVPRHLHQICIMAREAGKSTLDVGIALGLHPAILLAASSPAPFGVSEYAVANQLLNNDLKIAQCGLVDARVPSDSEIVIEGEILLDRQVDEGPFVDITGTYDIIRKQSLIEVERILCRENAVYQALLPSGSEHGLLMGLPQEAKIAENVAGVVPRVIDVSLTPGGCNWLHAAVSIEKQSEGDPKNAILAALSGHPSLKHVVVVDADIDVNSPKDVEWAIATRFQANRDLVIINDARGSSLDASGNQELSLTTKVGLDATRSLLKPKEKFERAKIPAEPKA
jgi:2,5-furandicarboxylate decarboxylase 1